MKTFITKTITLNQLEVEKIIKDYLVKESDFIAGFSGQLMNFNNRVFSIPGCFWTENLEYLHEHTDILSAAPDVLPGLVVIGNSHTGPLN
jgi:hypothetical protein